MVSSFAKIQWTANIEAPSNDRVLLLNTRPGASKHDNPFKKDVKLHIKTDGALWYCHFDAPASNPEPLKQRWTKYSLLLKAIKDYYNKKEVDVTEQVVQKE